MLQTMTNGSMLITTLLAFALIAQTQQIEWTFPKAGQVKKTIDGEQFYDLGNEFYARFDKLKEQQVAIVVLRNDLGALVDNVNREKPGDIPNKDQFMTAIAVEKAIVTPKGIFNKYLDSMTVDGRTIYVYRTHFGALIGAALSGDKSFVILMQYDQPKAVVQSPKETSKKLSTNYDRFSDETMIETDLMRLWGTTYDHLEVAFGGVYKGKQPTRPEVIGVIFKQIFKDTQVVEAQKIYVIADGQRFVIEGVKEMILKKAVENFPVYRHEFSVLMSFDTALILAKAKSVELKVGHIETKLSFDHQATLLSLLRSFDGTLR